MIGAIILGLVAGFIGKALMPGKDPGGFFATILIGLAGAVIGYLIFNKVLGIGDDDVFDLGGLLGAIVGVLILLFAYRKLVANRSTGTAAPVARDRRR
ncbi:MAG: GlsB/YeaQ/YmgE family stress response membrane protein [Solirubrobacterales bacterium]|nr:GlsB/YeaQ/YmgE family stress response membrane protein [Solirubrobacterales bacterium]